MVARLHRQMKAAIKCHETEAWAEILPIILLEIRAVIRKDLKANPAELVYGTTIRLLEEFFQASKNTSCSKFAEKDAEIETGTRDEAWNEKHKGDEHVEEEIETRQPEEQLPTANERNDFNTRRGRKIRFPDRLQTGF